MSFWTDQSMQPKRNYRFRVQLPNLTDGAGAPQSIIWWAKNFKPPSYDVSEATHDYMDNKYYWPGRVTWSDCTMQMVDPVTPNAVGITNQILQRSGYVIKTSATGAEIIDDSNQLQTISKNRSSHTMGDVVVEVLSADGIIIEQWTLKNAWIKGATFSDLSYEDDGLRTIDMTFRYDYAICDNYVDDGVNSTAGGTGTVVAGNEGQFTAGQNNVKAITP